MLRLASRSLRSARVPALCARISVSSRHRGCITLIAQDLGGGRRTGPHDLGGAPELLESPLPADKPLLPWELDCHALFACLASDGHFTTDEFRRAIEALPAHAHEEWGYYERWSAGVAALLRERGKLAPGELEDAVYGDEPTSSASGPRFAGGDEVFVRSEEAASTSWRSPHLRTPGYIFGQRGVVERHCGRFADPSLLAFGISAGPPQHLYRVRFLQGDVWPEAEAVAAADTIDVEIYENWLLAPEEQPQAPTEQPVAGPKPRVKRELAQAPSHGHAYANGHSHAHGHESDHDHVHLTRSEIECNAVDAEGPPRPGAAVHSALLQIAITKGWVTRDRVRQVGEKLESAHLQLPGARLVARAWVDPDFRRRLLQDAPRAALELGVDTVNPNAPTQLTVVDNDETTHNLIVCTLCSCYPAALLGPSPAWYKSRSYRARAVRSPRKLLQAEFGLEISPAVRVRVHDSTADLRYLVLPARPTGTDGWSEEDLLKLVTRDSMLGVARPDVPPPASMPRSSWCGARLRATPTSRRAK